MTRPTRKGPSAPPSPAAAPSAVHEALGPKTLRLVVDADHPAGVVRFVWRGWGEHSKEVASEPARRQEAHSIRALAIAFLCVAHCRAKGPADLAKLGTVKVEKHLNGWRIQATEAGQNWLQTLGNAYDARQAERRNAIGTLLAKVPGLLNEQNPEWTASRANSSFLCRDPSPVDIGAIAERAGPKLLFRLASDTEDLPPDSDFLALARELEDANPSWEKLLTPRPVKPPPGPLPGTDELLQSFTASLRAVAEDCSKLVTRGLSLSGDPHQKPLRLAHVYVNLDTKSPRPSEKEDTRSAPEAKTMLSALEVLFDPQSTRVVLVGEPGSGKSTFLQYVTLCLADPFCVAQGLASHLAGLPVPELLLRQKLVPLRILLREFAPTLDASQKGASEHVEKFLRSQLGGDAAVQLGEVLRRGLAFVLFDGLDEVPNAHVPAVRQAIESFAKSDFWKCRVAVTCRTESYRKKNEQNEDEFRLASFPPPHEIAPLSSQHRAWFVHAWYHELEMVQPQFRGEGAACAASLLNALATERLREMAGNPFFLTAMAALHRPDKPLPDTSAELMHQLVNSVLEESSKPRAGSGTKTGEPELACLLKDVRDGFKVLRLRLEAIAYTAREKRQDQASRLVDVDLLRARLQLDRQVSAGWVDKLVEVLRYRAGLLQSPDGQRFEFAYRFEEFLAGCHLANRDAWVKLQPSFVKRARELLKKQGDYARQVVIWAAGVNAHVQIDRSTVRELVSDLTPRSAADSGNLTDLELAADIARDAGMDHWQNEDVPDTSDTVTRLRTRLEEVRDGVARFDAKARARAASAIGRLGDPRLGVDLKDGVPDIDFTTELLPARRFKLGEGGEPVELKQPYRLSRYPVTVAQFQAFVGAGGYEDDGSDEATRRLTRWWTPDGLKWKRENDIAGPEDYDPVFQTPNHPRVGVSWYEATAFCAWLSEKLKLEIRLPHEAEWEQSARWNVKEDKADGRYFPWGGNKDAPDLAQRCNCSQTGIGHTSAVGLFPSGNAGCGAADMSGNAWEWCENWYDERSKQSRVLRGGSWVNYASSLRSACRDYFTPDIRINLIGFRCVWVGCSSP